MVEVLADLAAKGYTYSFSLENGLRCAACSAQPTIDSIWRFEGESDPDDESIVVALRCPDCGVRGVLVTAYGALLAGPEGDILASLKPTQ
jgi:DNA-directed RNA polymerase subunit RPC12/RpoP